MTEPASGFSILDRTGLMLGSCGTEEHRSLFMSVNDSSGRGKLHYEMVAEARVICEDCPILADCRLYAEKEEEVYGMWAGVYHDRSRGRRSMKRWS
jgi:hypothetical protein